jgi:hypothetical protein
MGFLLLIAAAICDFTMVHDYWLPAVSFRFDMVHATDALALVLLTLVGIADYRVRIREDARELRAAALGVGDGKGSRGSLVSSREDLLETGAGVSTSRSSPQLSAWRGRNSNSGELSLLGLKGEDLHDS